MQNTLQFFHVFNVLSNISIFLLLPVKGFSVEAGVYFTC